jgi:hypothetical protein
MEMATNKAITIHSLFFISSPSLVSEILICFTYSMVTYNRDPDDQHHLLSLIGERRLFWGSDAVFAVLLTAVGSVSFRTENDAICRELGLRSRWSSGTSNHEIKGEKNAARRWMR